LLIDEARKEGYLTVFINTEKGIDNDIDQISQKFCAQYTSDWDELRTSIIKSSLLDYIWKQIVQETEKDLMKKASDYVCDEVENRLYAKLTSPPYTQRSTEDPKILIPTPIVCLHYSEDYRDKIYISYVNQNGQIQNHIEIDSKILTSKIEKWDHWRQQIKQHDISTNDIAAIKAKVSLVKFIVDIEPSIIAITAQTLRSTKVAEKSSYRVKRKVSEA
jgi:transcriptional accessory protein Tex/SPT6